MLWLINEGNIKAYQVRLSEAELTYAKECFIKYFGKDDHLWLFGSRVDDNARGGDIDFYVQTQKSAKEAVYAETMFNVGLQEKIGEQKIDVVLHLINEPFTLPIYKVAQEKGVLLI